MRFFLLLFSYVGGLILFPVVEKNRVLYLYKDLVFAIFSGFKYGDVLLFVLYGIGENLSRISTQPAIV